VVNAFDDQCSVQWFVSRKPRGTWSELDKKRVADLIANGLMRPEGQVNVDSALVDGRWEGLDAHERLEVPPDLAAALNASKARANWDSSPPPVVRKFSLGSARLRNPTPETPGSKKPPEWPLRTSVPSSTASDGVYTPAA